MSDPVTPGWPASGAFPFMPFPLPGATAGPPTPGLAGGADLMKEFWSRLPGGAALPGFMIPTVDVDELDKRIGDLKAAERWIEVNLGMLRATIQGLEVQRHTIAAIQSLTTPATKASTQASSNPPHWPAPPESEPTANEAPADAATPPSSDWLAFLQAQFAQVAQAAMTPASTTSPAADKTRKKPAKKAVAGARKTTSRR